MSLGPKTNDLYSALKLFNLKPHPDSLCKMHTALTLFDSPRKQKRTNLD